MQSLTDCVKIPSKYNKLRDWNKSLLPYFIRLVVLTLPSKIALVRTYHFYLLYDVYNTVLLSVLWRCNVFMSENWRVVMETECSSMFFGGVFLFVYKLTRMFKKLWNMQIYCGHPHIHRNIVQCDRLWVRNRHEDIRIRLCFKCYCLNQTIASACRMSVCFYFPILCFPLIVIPSKPRDQRLQHRWDFYAKHCRLTTNLSVCMQLASVITFMVLLYVCCWLFAHKQPLRSMAGATKHEASKS